VGKGDKKSKRGKINRGTYGKRRARKTHKYVPAPVIEEKKKKTEVKTEEANPVVKAEVKPEKKKTTKKKTEKKETKKKKE
jgi:30S ribosomal protein S31